MRAPPETPGTKELPSRNNTCLSKDEHIHILYEVLKTAQAPLSWHEMPALQDNKLIVRPMLHVFSGVISNANVAWLKIYSGSYDIIYEHALVYNALFTSSDSSCTNIDVFMSLT